MEVVGSKADDTIDEKMAKAAERLEADFSKVGTKISRFPHVMRGIGGGGHGRDVTPIVEAILGPDGSLNFIEPSVVAIGPYHHGAPHLKKMEEVKLAAAYNLCRRSGASTAQVYEKVLSVVAAARDCYDTDDPSVAGVSDADFATMMFLDGCFLLQYMVAGDTDHVLHNRVILRQILSVGASIHKDIFLLENQIPWLVLDALAELVSVDVRRFVHRMSGKFQARRSAAAVGVRGGGGGNGNGNVDDVDRYKPPHLLGLLRFTLVGCFPEVMLNLPRHGYDYDYSYDTALEQSSSRSAMRLARIGFKLTPRTAPWFGDIALRRGFCLCELSLTPVFLNHVTACCLVNMAALEAITTGDASSASDGCVVSSYLSVLAMLVDEMEDVQVLRRRHLLRGSMSDLQALVFFKGLRHHVRLSDRHMVILEAIDAYIRRSSLTVAVHRFVYDNYFRMAAAITTITNVTTSVCTVLQTFKNGSNK